MGRTDTIEHYFSRNKQQDAVGRTHEAARTEQDKKCFPLLALPGEIRNKIYRHVALDSFPYLRDQPPITRVNRQLRAEALPICYRRPFELDLIPRTSQDWVKSTKEMIEVLGGESSPLHHITALKLYFYAEDEPGVKIMIQLMNDPKEMTEPYPDKNCEHVMVGSPDMDWADATAVRAARDQAATRLITNFREKEAELDQANALAEDAYFGHYDLPSKPADHRAAMDAMCALASACPRLTRAVCIADVSDQLD